MSDHVKALFGRIAGRYDLLNRLLSARLDLRWRRRALALVEGRAACCLDLACGTFDFGLMALDEGRAEMVIAGDFSLPMMRAGLGKPGPRALFPSGADALHLPYADQAFDLVIMAYGWRNVDDPARALAEIHRVLQPQGQLLILEFLRPTQWWPRLFYGSFGRFVLPLAGAVVAGDRAAYAYLRSSISGFLSGAEAATLCRSAGFAAPRWHSFVGGISHALWTRRNDG